MEVEHVMKRYVEMHDPAVWVTNQIGVASESNIVIRSTDIKA